MIAISGDIKLWPPGMAFYPAVDDLTVITCYQACRHMLQPRYLKTRKLWKTFPQRPHASLALQAGNEASVAIPVAHIDLQAYINESRMFRRLHLMHLFETWCVGLPLASQCC